MGVTIHFSGTLRSWVELPRLRDIAMRHARQWGCDVNEVDDEDGELFQWNGKELVEYHGPVKGLYMLPHPDAEGLLLLFSEDRRVWHFCKTQFAGPVVHMRLCTFFREISPLFSELVIVDDGGYWDTGDSAELERRMGYLNAAIGMLREKLPKGSTDIDRTPRSGDN